jgi:hypothetical protein
MVRIIVRSLKTHKSQRKRYVVITSKGIEFVKQLYAAREIPPQVTRLYQLLLGLIWVKGVMTVPAGQVDREGSVVNQARLRGCVIVNEQPRRIPAAVQHKIDAMIGKAPRWIYA